MSYTALAIVFVSFCWSVVGAIILACLQDSHRARDDRDPLISDLPLWQIIACGPVAWILRFFTDRRVDSLEQNVQQLLTINAWQLLVCGLIGLAIAVVFYLGFIFQLTGGWQ